MNTTTKQSNYDFTFTEQGKNEEQAYIIGFSCDSDLKALALFNKLVEGLKPIKAELIKNEQATIAHWGEQ